jgi:hypothetical protein
MEIPVPMFLVEPNQKESRYLKKLSEILGVYPDMG